MSVTAFNLLVNVLFYQRLSLLGVLLLLNDTTLISHHFSLHSIAVNYSNWS